MTESSLVQGSRETFAPVLSGNCKGKSQLLARNIIQHSIVDVSMMPPRQREALNDEITLIVEEEGFTFPKMINSTIVFDPALSQSKSATVVQAKLECMPPLRRCKLLHITERNEKRKRKSKSSRSRMNMSLAEANTQECGKLLATTGSSSPPNPKRRNSSDGIYPARRKGVCGQLRRSTTFSPVRRPSRWDAESSVCRSHQDCQLKPPSRNPIREITISACKTIGSPSSSLYKQLYDQTPRKREVGNASTAALLCKALDDLKYLDISDDCDPFQNSFANYKDSDLLLLDSSNSSIGSL
jgi:hypothetical protein